MFIVRASDLPNQLCGCIDQAELKSINQQQNVVKNNFFLRNVWQCPSMFGSAEEKQY